MQYSPFFSSPLLTPPYLVFLLPSTLTFFQPFSSLSLTIGHRLFPMSKTVFPPLFIWLVLLDLLELEEVFLPQEIFLVSLTRADMFTNRVLFFLIPCTYLSNTVLFSILYLIEWLLDYGLPPSFNLKVLGAGSLILFTIIHFAYRFTINIWQWLSECMNEIN